MVHLEKYNRFIINISHDDKIIIMFKRYVDVPTIPYLHGNRIKVDVNSHSNGYPQYYDIKYTSIFSVCCTFENPFIRQNNNSIFKMEKYIYIYASRR